jgi:hypothetical protein
MMASHGIDVLKAMESINAERVSAIEQDLLDDIFRRWWSAQDQSAAVAPQDAVDDAESDSDSEDDVFRRVKRQKVAPRTAEDNPVEARRAALKKEIREEVDRYYAYVNAMDWSSLIGNHPSPKYKVKDKSNVLPKDQQWWAEAIKSCNILDLFLYFSVLHWWVITGRQLFPKIFITAFIHLGKPYTNAFQERVFSKTTWMDGHLMQSQKATTLEMRALDALNRDNVRNLKIDETKSKLDDEETKVGDKEVEELLNNAQVGINGEQRPSLFYDDNDDDVVVPALATTDEPEE